MSDSPAALPEQGLPPSSTGGRGKYLTSSDAAAILIVVACIGFTAKAWWMPEVEQLSEHATRTYSSSLKERGIQSVSFSNGLTAASLDVEREQGTVDVCDQRCNLHENSLEPGPLPRFEVSRAANGRLEVQAKVNPDKQSFDIVRDRFDRAMGQAIAGFDEYQRSHQQILDSWARRAPSPLPAASAAEIGALNRP